MAPILTFDKSVLQALNTDEAVLLDHFFMTSITPLFFVETLADLEKAMKQGRNPEHEVGVLAAKTPDMHSYMAVHHRDLLAAELSGAQKIEMAGKAYRAGAEWVELSGQAGIMFRRTDEEEAFERWMKHEFQELERQIAKAWRRNLSNIDYSGVYEYFQKYYRKAKPKTLAQVKTFAEKLVDETEPERSLRFGLRLLGFPEAAKEVVVDRWQGAGKPLLRDFAPYFRYVYLVDFFFYLAIAADLISRVRPVDKADNKVDIAYLYYLPFCMVFTSSDSLHEKVVPLFLREEQSFVRGQDLKADLRNLVERYSALPEELLSRGLISFASDPPQDTDSLVTQLWDKHAPNWRNNKVDLSEDLQKVVIELMNRIDKDSQSVDPNRRVDVGKADFVQVKHQVKPRKGKWIRFRPDS
jgi:hypothetical protein